MEARLDESAPPEPNPEPSDEWRVTLPAPPEYPPVTEQPEFEGPADLETEERLWPEGLLDEAYRATPPRRWPTIVAVALAALVLILGGGAVVRYRLLRPANAGSAEPAGEARQEPTTAATPASTESRAVSQPSPVSEQPAAEPNSGQPSPPKVVAAKSSSTTAAHAGPARPARRAARHEPPSERSSWQREAELERGVPLSQVYVDGRGELVDAQGHPLAEH